MGSAIAARLAGCAAVNNKSARQASDIKIQTLASAPIVVVSRLIATARDRQR